MNTKHKFETLQDAKKAGYTTALPGIVRDCGPFDAVILDISGSNYYGYDYALTGNVNGPINAAKYGNVPNFPYVAYSVTVELTQETNKARRLGAYVPMFEPGAVETGIIQLKQWWDQQEFNPADWQT